MKLSVFGAGYVGCVTAASLASLGHTVWLVETSESKLAMLRDAECPVVEPGLVPLFSEQIRKKQILPTSSSSQAVTETELALVCVGTPSLSDGTTDIRQVRAVLSEVATTLKTRETPFTLALRSTVPYPFLAGELLPEFEKDLAGRYGKSVSFALNPEFLREGTAMKDFLNPPFIVIGTDHPAAETQLRALHREVHAPVHIVSIGNASLLKYACNAFHALKIVFANEMASLSPLFNADSRLLMDMFCEDRLLNISPAYLRPGFAYGGSCLPKDLRTLGRLSAGAAIQTPLLDSIENSNRQLIEKTLQAVAEFGVRKIGLLGLTFKTGTDDFRNSPLVELAERLLGKGFDIVIYDPDVDMRKIHGQNLRYIEERMRHLTQHLKSDFSAVLREAELLIVGKSIKDIAALLAKVPADRWVLDLTRQLAPRSEKPPILQLETFSRSTEGARVTGSSAASASK